LKFHFAFGQSARSAAILLERVEYLQMGTEKAEVSRLDRSCPQRSEIAALEPANHHIHSKGLGGVRDLSGLSQAQSWPQRGR
jgi:hypothetical protein